MELPQKPFIIAEAGKNFITMSDSDIAYCLSQAKWLARSAKENGASAIKFQTHVLEDEKLKRNPSRYTWIKMNEDLTPYDDFWLPLANYCAEQDIFFMSTPMSKMAAEKINRLIKIWKVGSADLTDRDLLEYLVSTKKPIILSTGMSTLTEIDLAVLFLKDKGADFMLMHCVSLYPCPVEKLNLNTIDFLKQRYGVPVGFSDHSLFPEVPAFAMKHGITVIEKHFTLNREAYGPDHKISLETKEFKKMVDLINLAYIQYHADGVVAEKILLDEEKDYWKVFRTRK